MARENKALKISLRVSASEKAKFTRRAEKIALETDSRLGSVWRAAVRVGLQQLGANPSLLLPGGVEPSVV